MSFDPTILPMPNLGALCAHCGYALRGLPELRCPECGWAFTLNDLIPPGDMPLVRIHGGPVPLTREVTAVLRAAGVPYLENVMTTVLGAATRGIELVCVPREAYFDAVHALLTASESGVLPAPPPHRPAGPAWLCACGATVPGNFDICWRCEAERPA